MATVSEIAELTNFDSYEDAVLFIAQEIPKIEYGLGIIAGIALLQALWRIVLFFINCIKMFF